jgi:uncharacterized protein YheU (UPF0270 family)
MLRSLDEPRLSRWSHHRNPSLPSLYCSAGDGERVAPEQLPERVEIPASRLSPGALEGLIEELVTRDGTDYGAEEQTLEQKKHAVARQIDRGEVVIVFDPASETCNIIPKDAG